MVNGAHPPGSISGSMSTATRDCVIARTLCRQYSLSNANFCSSLHDVVLGAFISRSPGSGSLNMPKIARLRNLSVPCIRRMCPAHASLLARTHLTRSKVRHFADASWRGVLPVMILTILAFAPFSAAATSAVIRHASEPYVRMLQMQALYSRIRRFK